MSKSPNAKLDAGSHTVLPPALLGHNPLEALLLLGSVVVMVGVSWYFDATLNRVFDISKALVLKTGGGLLILAWLAYAVFGPGLHTGSLKRLFKPVMLFLSVAVVSSLLSIDVPTSIQGVYERQFGLQGLAVCVGLSLLISSLLSSKKAAVVMLLMLLVIGGVIGAYAVIQSYGWDPFPFFYKRPDTKVYSFLGNANFAGNTLALIAPVSLMLGLTAVADAIQKKAEGASLHRGMRLGLIGAGSLVCMLLLLLPSYLSVSEPDSAKRIVNFQAGLVFTLMSLGITGYLGYPSFVSRRPKPITTQTLVARALHAGFLVGLVLNLYLGILFTRTRGAWVGTGAALAVLFLLFFKLFPKGPRRTRIWGITWGAFLVSALLLLGYVLKPSWVCGAAKGRCMVVAETIRSIPAAFNTEKLTLGIGQSTRMFLWSESPRVLMDHEKTLERQRRDHQHRLQKADPDLLAEIKLPEPSPLPSQAAFDRSVSWRTKLVWLFGIGVETYRYAFMSHKSLLLEALDPMTNHDNPHNNYLYTLASFGILGLLSYAWLLFNLLKGAYRAMLPAPPPAAETDAQVVERPLSEQLLALGVVGSFFSYAVYSIAGFDSIVSSVLFYSLLGISSVLLLSDAESKPTRLSLSKAVSALLSTRTWAQNRRFQQVVGVFFVLLWGVLSSDAAYGGLKSYRADRAFVGRDPESRREAALGRPDRLKSLQRAIAEMPGESYYKQMLGDYLNRRAQARLDEARTLFRQRKGELAASYLGQSQKDFKLALQAYWAALDHAWAPENIFISSFQIEYSLNRQPEARDEIRMALLHSPHLAPILANLALVESNLGNTDAAKVACQHALQVNPKNKLAGDLCRTL